jgi:dipeptide/tripeptide permease
LNLTAPLSLAKLAQAISTGFGFYARRILFCMGFTFVELPIYWLRPHWIIMWAGVIAFLWRAVKKRRLEFWEAFALSFILVYLGPLIAVAHIYNYGVRMIVPVIPMLLLLSITSLPPKLRLGLQTGAITEQ